jgi:2',3'-cyclic-nucleotide 2'-phosphodiesterase/3'-nucleotidase
MLLKRYPRKLQRQTRIYAQIGKKTYIGNIYSGGNYEIKIPKQKAGTTIKIWGSNIAGRGPMVKVKVKANLDME